MEDVLFSLLIPTRNRAYTAAILIREVLTFLPNDCELVVQDCGTDGELPPLIADLIGDPRLRYDHAGKLLSMTENWNHGMKRCRGKYVCIIGDDDGITRKIAQVVRWADANQVEALSWHYLPDDRYYWPDHCVPDEAGTFQIHRYSGTLHKYSSPERLHRAVRGVGHMGDLRGIPHVYHGMVRRDFLECMQIRPGVYFDGLVPDVYAQFFLATLTKECWWVDYPVSTVGVSAKSNSGIVARNAVSELATVFEEFDERERLDYPLPAPIGKSWLGHSSILEGICRGLTNAGRSDLLRELDVPTCYAQAIYYDGPARAANLRRYFRASASFGRGRLRSAVALFNAYIRRAAIWYLKAKHIPEVEVYDDLPLLRRCRDVKDIADMMRLQEQVFDDLHVTGPWDLHTSPLSHAPASAVVATEIA
jgi:hypothetical protein